VVVPDLGSEGVEATRFTPAAAGEAPPRQTTGVVEVEAAASLVAIFLIGGGEGGDTGATVKEDLAALATDDTAPLTRFMLGLEEAVGSRPDVAESDASPEAVGSAEGSPSAGKAVIAAVDKVFRQWLRDLHAQEMLDSVVEALLETARRATLPGTRVAPADPGWLPPAEPAGNPAEPREEKDELPEEETGLSESSCSTPLLSESAPENTGAWVGPWAAAFLLAAVPGLQDGARRRRSPRPARTRSLCGGEG